MGEEVVEVMYKAAKKELRDAIRTRKRPCWKDLCDVVERDPFGRAYNIATEKFKGYCIIPDLEKESSMGYFPRGWKSLAPKSDHMSELERVANPSELMN